ncbi:MAG: adenylate kinase [Candidatus Heimdallarchaeota archaeon]|nr:adenylate kinase [Candidatus Heimdallarchaeota archaeon]MBY8993695.1 adenylate kinase [Candidatus Heimdallarchaeota archaeon]
MEKEGSIAIIGGVPGVGKTTVINEALALAKKENFEITTIVYGSVMMEIAKEEFNVDHRDQLRILPADVQKEIQRRAAFRIDERAQGKVVLVDTHYTIKTGEGTFLQGIPQWVSDSLNPKLLVIIETYPDEIINRREKDSSRKRDDDTADVLFEHQLINKTVASTICQKTGALLSVIKNGHGKASEAGKVLLLDLMNLR